MELRSHPLRHDLRHPSLWSSYWLTQDPNTSLLYKKILTLNYKIPHDISPFARDILKSLLTTNNKRLGLTAIRTHEFYRLYSHAPVEGILVGQHTIPIDHNILREAVRLGHDAEYARECLLTNKHNAATTTYYLLLKQRHESGFQSIADINSSRFDPSLLAYQPNYSRSATPNSQQRSRQRSSVDKFLEIELQEAFGL